MIDRPRKLALLAVAAAGMLPAAAAQAHCCRSSYVEPPPLYPYVVYDEPLYDVELTQNVFAVPYRLRRFPYVHCLDGCGSRAPRMIERRAVVEDGDAPPTGGGQRVIRAEAEVTIIGPDRMNIRLFRKGR